MQALFDALWRAAAYCVHPRLILWLWLCTLVFVFSSLWFAHSALAALQPLRSQVSPSGPPGTTFEPLAPATPPAPQIALTAP